MKKILFFAALFSISLIFAACDENLSSGYGRRTCVTVNVSLPEISDIVEIVDHIYRFRNISSGKISEFSKNAEIELPAGYYDVEFSARVFSLSGGAHSSLRANRSGIYIAGENIEITLSAYRSVDNHDLIIAEIFFAGTLRKSGNQYLGDDYIKLYNNTDHVIYADGLTIFESKFLTTRKYDYSPEIIDEAMTVHALYTIPGGGRDVPVAPGEYLLLADTGIDHRVANDNSFDLSHADFEWYDVSTVASSIDIDGAVTNLDKWYCYTNSCWMLHNRGLRAFGIARIPVDKDTYLKKYLYSYTYEEVTPAGTFPMSQTAYRLPNTWIVDVVNCSVDSEYAWQVCSPSLDCGYTGCGTIDNDKTRYFHSVRRKLQFVTDNGRAVLADTNNSSEDFNRMCIPSEIELQHSAMDVSGTPCVTITYDGIIPKP